MAPEKNCRVEVSHPVFLGRAGNELAELDLSPDRPDFVTSEGVEVWMERKVQKARYLTADGDQVGPVHANFVPAIIWARAQGWRDPSLPGWFNDACIAEVAAGGAPERHGGEQPADPFWTCPEHGTELAYARSDDYQERWDCPESGCKFGRWIS